MLYEKDGRLVASSEDKAIVEIGGKPMRELRPGEIINIPTNGTSYIPKQGVRRTKRPCFFEPNYLGNVLSSFDILNLKFSRS